MRRGRDAAEGRGRAQRRALEPRVLARRGRCGSWSGRWSDVRKDIAARQLEEGPEVSGVFARPTAAGDAIALLDPRRRVERTLGAGVRARRRDALRRTSAPTWLITGTDDVGVAAAAARSTEDRCATTSRSRSRTGRGCRCRWCPSRRRRELPPPRAARCTPPGRPSRGVVPGARRASPLACEHPRVADRGARASRRRRARGGAAGPSCGGPRPGACRSRSSIALINALVTRDGATVIVRGPAAAVARRRSTSRSRRSPTAACSGCGSWRSSCTAVLPLHRRPSTPTSCCARCAASRCARA